MTRLLRSFPPGVAAILCLMAPSLARAESDIERVLKQYDAQTVTGYIQPMADLFGANMNAGFYRSAAIPKMGLTFEFTIVGMGSLVGDDHKTYNAPLPPGFGSSTFRTATIFGAKGATVYTSDSLSYSGTDGVIDATLFPLVVPQLTIGNVAGTQLVLRFVPTPAVGDDAFPKTTLFAVGARHSISQYFMAVPLDVAASIMYTSFTVGDIIDFKGLSIGAQASKSWAVATLYGGLAWEQTTMSLEFISARPGGGKVALDLDGDNSFRFTLGAGLSLGILKINADANFGAVTNFSAGLGFGI